MVPTEREEAFRDLVRAREGVRRDLMRARHRVSKLLLRREIVYPGPDRAWTQRYRAWLGQLCFDDTTSGLVLEDLLAAHDHLLARRERLERALVERVPSSPWAETIGRLRCLHGIDTLSAAGLCAEIADFDRFPDPGKLASFVGLVPSVEASGERTRLGSISKTGSGHARRLLVEAAHHYRHQPRVGVCAPTPPTRPRPASDRARLAGATPPPRQLASASTPGGANPPASAPWPSPANSATTSGGSRHCANSGWAIPPQTSGGGCRGARAGNVSHAQIGCTLPL